MEQNSFGVIFPENRATKPAQLERLKEFLIANRWNILSILSLAVGIGGLAFGIWSHFACQQKPLLTYGVSSVHGQIVRSGNLGDLKILYKEVEVQGDISIVYVVFQNLGTAAIERNDILTPIYVKLAGNAQILEAIIQKNEKTRFDVTKPSLDQSEVDSGQLGVGWRILEKNDGFVVQITYAGSFSTGLQVTGNIKGQQQGLQKQEYPAGIWRTQKEYSLSQLLFLAVCCLSLYAVWTFGLAVPLHLFPVGPKLKEDLGPERLRLIKKEARFYSISLMLISTSFFAVGVWLWCVAK